MAGSKRIKTNAAVTVTTAGTRVQITSTATRAPYVFIQAKPGNTGRIFVGDSDVSSAQYMASLAAGDAVSIDASAYPRGGSSEIDLSTLYADSASNGDGLLYSYEIGA